MTTFLVIVGVAGVVAGLLAVLLPPPATTFRPNPEPRPPEVARSGYFREPPADRPSPPLQPPPARQCPNCGCRR